MIQSAPQFILRVCRWIPETSKKSFLRLRLEGVRDRRPHRRV